MITLSRIARKPEFFNLQPVRYDKVIAVRKSLRLDSSTCSDKIAAKFIKNVAEFISSLITYIINCCIDSSNFPEQWNISRIWPIPKTNCNNPTNFADYRPISVLPVLPRYLIFKVHKLGFSKHFIQLVDDFLINKHQLAFFNGPQVMNFN